MLRRKIINKIVKIRVINRILGFPSRKKLIEEIRGVLDGRDEERIFVFPSPSCPWGYMFQRPQQIARALSQKGYTVFYCVDTSFMEDPDWGVRGLKRLEDKIYLFNDGIGGRTLSQFSDKLIIWQYWPHQYKFVEKIIGKESILIMDCIDHITTFSQYKSILDDYKKSISRADVVLATSRKIHEDILKVRTDCVLVPNAVNQSDFEFEKRYSMLSEETDTFNSILSMKKNNNKIIGYYGAIAEWIDFELISYLAQIHPYYEFVFIGQKYPGIRKPNHNNIHFFDRISYFALINIVDMFDVAILPFKINDITINTSPVKVFEYMAAQKPVVSTRLPEIEPYDVIFIADSPEEFSQKIGEAIDSMNDDVLLHELRKNASEQTWDARVELVIEQLFSLKEG